MSVALQDYGGQPLGDGAAQSTSSTTTATGQGEYTLTITAEHAAVIVNVGSTLIGVVKPHTTGKYQVQAGSNVTLLSAETTQWVMTGTHSRWKRGSVHNAPWRSPDPSAQRHRRRRTGL